MDKDLDKMLIKTCWFNIRDCIFQHRIVKFYIPIPMWPYVDSITVHIETSNRVYVNEKKTHSL